MFLTYQVASGWRCARGFDRITYHYTGRRIPDPCRQLYIENILALKAKAKPARGRGTKRTPPALTSRAGWMDGWRSFQSTGLMLSVFLQLYIENILALETKTKNAGRGTGKSLPLAIMTSDDTHAHTQALLEEHGYFGASPAQIHLLKQEKVGVVHMQGLSSRHLGWWMLSGRF